MTSKNHRTIDIRKTDAEKIDVLRTTPFGKISQAEMVHSIVEFYIWNKLYITEIANSELIQREEDDWWNRNPVLSEGLDYSEKFDQIEETTP